MKYDVDLSVFWFFRRIKVLPCILETDKSNDNNNTVIKVLSVKSSFCIWPVISFGILCVCSHWVVSNFLQPHGLWDPMWPTRLLCPWNSPGRNTGVGCHFLLQGIFPGPGIKPRSPTLKANSLPTEPPEKSLGYYTISFLKSQNYTVSRIV